MFKQAYYITLDNGLTIRIERESAAQAMGQALRENLGRKIIKCWSGAVNPSDPATYGVINYEVPTHEAMTKRPRLVGPRKPKGPGELFNDETILSESARALIKANHGENLP